MPRHIRSKDGRESLKSLISVSSLPEREHGNPAPATKIVVEQRRKGVTGHITVTHFPNHSAWPVVSHDCCPARHFTAPQCGAYRVQLCASRRPKTPSSPRKGTESPLLMPHVSQMDVSRVDPEEALVDSEMVEPGDISADIDESLLRTEYGNEDKVLVSIR